MHQQHNILLDENIAPSWKEILQKRLSEAYNITHVDDIQSGMTDVSIIQYIETHKANLITGDKDFGDLVFRDEIAISESNIIFIREQSIALILEKLIEIIQKIADLSGYFIVISLEKVRYTQK